MFRKQILVECAYKLDFLVDYYFWDTDDRVLLRKVWEFGAIYNTW